MAWCQREHSSRLPQRVTIGRPVGKQLLTAEVQDRNLPEALCLHPGRPRLAERGNASNVKRCQQGLPTNLSAVLLSGGRDELRSKMYAKFLDGRTSDLLR